MFHDDRFVTFELQLLLACQLPPTLLYIFDLLVCWYIFLGIFAVFYPVVFYLPVSSVAEIINMIVRSSTSETLGSDESHEFGAWLSQKPPQVGNLVPRRTRRGRGSPH